jgi:hypothetical protein
LVNLGQEPVLAVLERLADAYEHLLASWVGIYSDALLVEYVTPHSAVNVNLEGLPCPAYHVLDSKVVTSRECQVIILIIVHYE